MLNDLVGLESNCITLPSPQRAETKGSGSSRHASSLLTCIIHSQFCGDDVWNTRHQTNDNKIFAGQQRHVLARELRYISRAGNVLVCMRMRMRSCAGSALTVVADAVKTLLDDYNVCPRAFAVL